MVGVTSEFTVRAVVRFVDLVGGSPDGARCFSSTHSRRVAHKLRSGFGCGEGRADGTASLPLVEVVDRLTPLTDGFQRRGNGRTWEAICDKEIVARLRGPS